MRDSKKAAISLLSIVVIFTLISVVVIYPYMNSETFYYEDKKLRSILAGKLDYLVIGSSHGLAAFKPSILDEELGCNSYNLSGGMMTFAARYHILKKEIRRNPVHTVVIEVSHNALTSANDEGYGEGESAFLPRLDNLLERTEYLVKYVKVDDWLNVYAKMFIQGLSYYKYRGINAVDYAAKGYHSKPTRDITLQIDYIADRYNKVTIALDFTQGNLEYLKEMVHFCKERDIRVIVAVVPISDVTLWQCDNYDDFDAVLRDFCNEIDCEYYNFNLLKDRYELFNDRVSFFDGVHLSDDGATVFTKTYADVIKMIDNEETISTLFFKSYEAMKDCSPYMSYMKHNKMGN